MTKYLWRWRCVVCAHTLGPNKPYRLWLSLWLLYYIIFKPLFDGDRRSNGSAVCHSHLSIYYLILIVFYYSIIIVLLYIVYCWWFFFCIFLLINKYQNRVTLHTSMITIISVVFFFLSIVFPFIFIPGYGWESNAVIHFFFLFASFCPMIWPPSLPPVGRANTLQ